LKKAEQRHPNREQILEQLRQCTEDDFKGHTDFQKLTPSQRLDALAAMAQFVSECKGLAARQD
jgi:hypothetical protein